MARARNIKPGFYLNEELAGCSLMARFIFPGLWMLADREGRLEDRPLRIKAAVLPYDNGDMNALLDELQQAGMVLRYMAHGQRYIQVLGFTKHQNPHQNEKQSSIPAPEQHQSLPEKSDDQCKSTPVQAPEQHQSSTIAAPEQHHSAPADSLIPDSLITPSCAERRTSDRFPEFWDAWPRTDRKVNRKGCLEKWRAKGLDSQADAILTDIAIQRRTAKWRDGFEPAPATYLSQERWRDGIGESGKPAEKPVWRDGDGRVVQMYQPTAEELAEAERIRQGHAA